MAGVSPVEYMKKYPGRFPMLHIKDKYEIGQSGMVGFEPIFRNMKTAGTESFTCIEVEDRSFESSREKVLDSLRLSKRFMEQFVIWKNTVSGASGRTDRGCYEQEEKSNIKKKK